MNLPAFILCVLSVLCGQSSLPAQTAGKGIGFGGNSSVGIVRPPASEVKTITYTALTPLRQWTSSDGATMMALLLAHDPRGGAGESADAENPKAPPIILRDDKVRFLKDKKVFEIPLASLSAADQDYINALIASASTPLSSPPGTSSTSCNSPTKPHPTET